MKSSLLFQIQHFFQKRGNVYIKTKKNPEDKILTVIFSSLPQKSMLDDYKGSCIQVYDNKMSKKWTHGAATNNTSSGGWYFGDVAKTMRALEKEIEKGFWRKIVFVGSSKSGFAALLYAHFFAVKFPKRKVSCVAYSPATFLRPGRTFEFDKTPSLDILHENGFCTDIFEKYEDLSQVLQDSPMHRAIIVYSKGHEADFSDFKRIRPFAFVRGAELSKETFDRAHLHPHLTLEYIWRHDRDQFYELISQSVE